VALAETENGRVKPQLARLIVPLDTSVTAESVLPWAALLARDHGMEIRLVTVWDEREPLPGVERGRALEVVIDELRHYLDGVARRPELREASLTKEVLTGNVVEAITREAARIPGSAVMVGTHGASGYRAGSLGSVTERLLRSLRVPVLVIPLSEER
jgi:nucleotide-binding universal stress UspA family protein